MCHLLYVLETEDNCILMIKTVVGVQSESGALMISGCAWCLLVLGFAMVIERAITVTLMIMGR
jgi:hypothetical protein